MSQSPIETAHRELKAAYTRLTDSEAKGPIARRNARRAAFSALAKIRGLIDQEWPAPPRRAAERKRRTPQKVIRDLERAGWKVVSSMDVLALIAAAGVQVRRAVTRTPVLGIPESFVEGSDTFAPGWAVTIASLAPGKLGRARNNLRERKAILTELALQKGA